MREKKFVQYRNDPNGVRWEVVNEAYHERHHLDWYARSPDKSHTYWLPRSEYILCEPPIEWEDVTGGRISWSGIQTDGP